MTPHHKTRQRRREDGTRDGNDYAPLCSKCDKPNDRLPQRYCRACHAAYQKLWRSQRVYVSRDHFCFTEKAA